MKKASAATSEFRARRPVGPRQQRARGAAIRASAHGYRRPRHDGSSGVARISPSADGDAPMKMMRPSISSRAAALQHLAAEMSPRGAASANSAGECRRRRRWRFRRSPTLMALTPVCVAECGLAAGVGGADHDRTSRPARRAAPLGRATARRPAGRRRRAECAARSDRGRAANWSRRAPAPLRPAPAAARRRRGKRRGKPRDRRPRWRSRSWAAAAGPSLLRGRRCRAPPAPRAIALREDRDHWTRRRRRRPGFSSWPDRPADRAAKDSRLERSGSAKTSRRRSTAAPMAVSRSAAPPAACAARAIARTPRGSPRPRATTRTGVSGIIAARRQALKRIEDEIAQIVEQPRLRPAERQHARRDGGGQGEIERRAPPQPAHALGHAHQSAEPAPPPAPPSPGGSAMGGAGAAG